MNIKSPIKTEYKGVVYRSKSEAMFARWIELSRKDCRFIYEPKLGVDGWRPDFLLNGPCWLCDERGGTVFINCEVIEYKPAFPTKSYLESWFSKAKEWFEKYSNKNGIFYFSLSASVYYGSPFSDLRRGCFYLGKDWREVWHDNHDWLSYYLNAVKSTRFDLI